MTVFEAYAVLVVPMVRTHDLRAWTDPLPTALGWAAVVLFCVLVSRGYAARKR